MTTTPTRPPRHDHDTRRPDGRRRTRGGLHRRGRHRRGLKTFWAALLLVFVCGIGIMGGSYVQALTAPGYASWIDRTVGWVRDHGGGPLVNIAENWYYTRHAPANATPGRAAIPVASHQPPHQAVTSVPNAHLPQLPALSHLPGEAVWVPGRNAHDGHPASYTTYFQPDSSHASVVAGVAFIRAGATTAHLVAGTTQPGGGAWRDGAHVPTSAVPHLVATFNSGYKLKDTAGGFYSHGRVGKPLVDGAASLVINDRGAISVGQWGRDVSMNPHIVSVRQNLALIVEHGKPVQGLADNSGGRWGAAGSQFQYTWRSGIGTDRYGDVIYVAGNKLNLPMLASAMAQAGIVTGMPLDIHKGMVTYASWTPTLHGIHAQQLLPDMPGRADRYLAADQRDFVYLSVR